MHLKPIHHKRFENLRRSVQGWSFHGKNIQIKDEQNSILLYGYRDWLMTGLAMLPPKETGAFSGQRHGWKTPQVSFVAV